MKADEDGASETPLSCAQTCRSNIKKPRAWESFVVLERYLAISGKLVRSFIRSFVGSCKSILDALFGLQDFHVRTSELQVDLGVSQW